MSKVYLYLIPDRDSIMRNGTINVYIVDDECVDFGVAESVIPSEEDSLLIREEIGRQKLVGAVAPERIIRVKPVDEASFKRYEAKSQHPLMEIGGVSVVFV